jgi:hypothetical protein
LAGGSLFTETTVAIDGSKFKAANNCDKNFTRAKMERLCLSEIKSGHIRDAIRRGLAGKEYALLSTVRDRAQPSPRPSACASHYSSERRISESGADVPRLRQ